MTRCWGSARHLFQKHGILLTGLVFALSLGLRLYQLDNKSIWMDEDRQAELAGRGFDLALVSRAAEQHQPPIDYYAEAIGLALFGVTEHGARVHAAIWGALAAALFFCLLRRLFRHPLPVLIGTAMLALDVYMVRYSQEGRPIFCGIFFAVLYLYTLHVFLFPHAPLGGPLPAGAPLRRLLEELPRGAVLLIVVFGFFLSVGFQPIVFVGVSSVAMLPGMLDRRIRYRIMIAMAITFLAFLAALPILQQSMGHGEQLIGRTSLWGRLSGVVTNLGAFDRSSWWSKYDRLIPHHQTLIASLALPALLGGFIDWKGKRSVGALTGGLYLLVFALLYPPIFDVIYRSQISWKLQTRYFLTLQPVLIAAMAALTFFSLRAATQLTLRRFKAARWGFCLVILALFVRAEQGNNATLKSIYHRQEKTDWRALYALFQQQGQPRDSAFIMNLMRIDRWTPEFYAMQFYYPKRHRKVRPTRLENLPTQYARNRFHKRHNLFLVTPYGNEKIAADFWKGADEVAFHRFNKLAVIQVKNKGRMNQHITKVFEVLTKRLKKEESNFRAWSLFAQLKLADNDLKGAALLIHDLNAMDKRKKLYGPVIRPLVKMLKRKQKSQRTDNAIQSPGVAKSVSAM